MSEVLLGTEDPGIRFQKALEQRAGLLRSGWESQAGGSRCRNPGGGRPGALVKSLDEAPAKGQWSLPWRELAGTEEPQSREEFAWGRAQGNIQCETFHGEGSSAPSLGVRLGMGSWRGGKQLVNGSAMHSPPPPPGPTGLPSTALFSAPISNTLTS